MSVWVDHQFMRAREPAINDLRRGRSGGVMETVTFAVNQRACAFSDWELRKKNIEFLEGIDPGYYSFIASTNLEKLTSKDKQYAALSLRISYYQGLETLFALIAATVQAPNCPLGWMLAYKNHELKKVVQKISSESDIYTRLRIDYVSWERLANLIHSHVKVEENEKKSVSERFGFAWRGLASDFLDTNHEDEYNSAKHGLRVRSGGFSLSVGKTNVWGVSAPPDKMECLGGSEHGTTFFVKTKISERDEVNFRPKRISFNWHPQNLLYGLELISASINNVVAFLKLINGVQPDQCSFRRLDDDCFDKPWEMDVGVISWNCNKVLEPCHVHLFSKEEIIDSYSGELASQAGEL